MKQYQEEKWQEKLTNLTSLAAINPKTIKLGTPHPVWETAGYSGNAVRQAISKVSFLTNTVMIVEKCLNFFWELCNLQLWIPC